MLLSWGKEVVSSVSPMGCVCQQGERNPCHGCAQVPQNNPCFAMPVLQLVRQDEGMNAPEET